MFTARCVRICRGMMWVTLLCAIARADSIQLRDGRHLQGKYLGGTTTAVEFMTDTAIEYFPISNVLVLVFDSADAGYKPTEANPGATRLPRPIAQPKPGKKSQRCCRV
jgi:hypothetical protein